MGRNTAGLAVTIALVGLLLAGCSAAKPPSASERPAQAYSATPIPTPTPTPTPIPVVAMIGDSIMRGFGLSSTDQAWPQLLATSRGWTMNNLGCDDAGVLSVGVYNQCNGNYESIVRAAIALNPTTVFFEGSSNDLGQDDDALAAATATEVAELHQALPQARIIGVSTIWDDTTPPDQLATIDDQVKSAVLAVGGKYLDLGQPLGGHPEWMQYDDIHPTSDGQAAIAQAVAAALQTQRVRVR